jgi:hypothetical protein
MLRASFRKVQFSLADDYLHVLLFRKLMKATYMLEYVLRLTDRTRRRQRTALLEGLIANVAQDGRLRPRRACRNHEQRQAVDSRRLVRDLPIAEGGWLIIFVSTSDVVK